jgi:hypothetical protein
MLNSSFSLYSNSWVCVPEQTQAASAKDSVADESSSSLPKESVILDLVEFPSSKEIW